MTMFSDDTHNPPPTSPLPQYCTNVREFLEAVIEPKDFHGTKVNIVILALRLLLYFLGKGKGHPCTGTETLHRPYGP